MALTPVAPIDAGPAVPSSAAAETTFDAAYEAFNAWEKDKLQPQANALADATYNNAQEALNAATAASTAATTATAARETAVAAANFKGNWSDLTGALNMPACVRHSGRFWVLLANLANVATAQPGASASWAALDAGTVPSQLLNTAGATVNAVPGVRYLFAANNIVLSAPTTSVKGDYHGWRRMAGVTGCTWVWGTAKVRGGTPGTLNVDMQEIDLFYEDTTQGYI